MTKILMLLILTSCSTSIRTQGTKMLSPEAQGSLGKGQLELRLESQKRDKFDFADNTTKNSVDGSGIILSAAPVGEVGLFNIVDVYLQPHIESATIIGLKAQFLGKTRKEADKGNFSSSIIIGTGGASEESSSDSDLETIFTDNVTNIEFNTNHTEIGLISGYRWSPTFLHYANFVYQDQTVKGKVTNKSGTLSNTPFKYRQDGHIYSTGFIHYFGSGQWKIDYSYLTTQWSRTQKQTVNSISTSIGFNW